MIGTKPLSKAMPKGMDEFFSFIRLLSDNDAYKEKAGKLAEQIARSEELVGARDTLEKAEAYFAEANKMRIQAEALKMQTEKDCAAKRAEVEAALAKMNAESDAKADRAAVMMREAKEREEQAQERQSQVTGELSRRERDVIAAEKSIQLRNDDLTRREQALAAKADKVKALFA